MRRPMTLDNRNTVTTPRTAGLIRLLGGPTYGNLAFSGDEMSALRRLYGYKKGQPNKKPPPPPAPKKEDFVDRYAYQRALSEHERALAVHAQWQDPVSLLQAGADRNCLRHAELDGLRLVAWLSRYMEPNEDPLRMLIKMAIDSGMDVDPADVEWSDEGELGDDTR